MAPPRPRAMMAPLIFVGGALTSERLLLEPLRPAHAELMFDGFADPGLYRWIDVVPPADRDDLRLRFERIAVPYAPTGDLWLNWAVRLRETGPYVGLVEATVRPDRAVYLAYYVFAASQRQGYGREACAAVLDHLWRAYDAIEVRCEMDYRNVPSRCLAEALGFRRRTRNVARTLRGEVAVDYRYRLKRPA
jgi:ribosomal-protein-alanine N-acetyltransferase